MTWYLVTKAGIPYSLTSKAPAMLPVGFESITLPANFDPEIHTEWNPATRTYEEFVPPKLWEEWVDSIMALSVITSRLTVAQRTTLRAKLLDRGR